MSKSILNAKKPVNHGIVLIADRTFAEYEDNDLNGPYLEKIPNSYFEEVYDGLRLITPRVHHYNTPKELIDNIKRHSRDVVFTIYGGENSRNRMALIPSICESYELKYVGADTYARVVCQDKYISKEYAKSFGLNSPKSIIARTFDDKKRIKLLKLPVVVKPLLEGSSIGINSASLAYSHQEAQIRFEVLLESFHQPILIEEFIPGREVNCCISGSKNEVIVSEVVETFAKDNSQYFDNHLYTAEDKQNQIESFDQRIITEEIGEEIHNSLKTLFIALDKMDYMRIDGKYYNGNFTLLELTPDAYLGYDSAFFLSACHNGLEYEDMLRLLINNALDYYHNPYSNG